jgi:hypothetical protein
MVVVLPTTLSPITSLCLLYFLSLIQPMTTRGMAVR